MNESQIFTPIVVKMLLQSRDTGERMDSHLVTLYVTNSKFVGMAIGYFIYFLIYLRENKAIKVRVSNRVRVGVKSSLKSCNIYYSRKSAELGFCRVDSGFGFLKLLAVHKVTELLPPSIFLFL